MQKPNWRRRASRYLVESPFMRLRVDELELHDGTILPEYFVREAAGFVIVFATTADDRIVLIRQYRYGSDGIHLELPAGGLDAGEDAAACAARELAEETGYVAAAVEAIGFYYPEPVRSSARAHLFVARDAVRAGEPKLDPTEVLEVELATFDEFRAMLRDGRIDAGHNIVAGYRALDYLGRLG